MEPASYPPAKRQKLLSALARWSGRSIHGMQSVLQGTKENRKPSGAAWRAVARTLAPARACFKLLVAPAKNADHPPQQFCVADVKRLLQYVARECPCFRTFLLSTQGHLPLRVVLSHDETTGGNVLATDPRQKATIFYLTFVGLQSIHESARAWLPLGVCSHEQVSRIRGGLSKVHSLFFEDWHQQNLGQRFEVAPGVQVMLEIAAFCADMDAQRAALEAKGSAGLRPCAFCMNCVSAYSEAASHTDALHSIAEKDIRKFKQHTQRGLQAWMRSAWQKWPTMTAKEQDTVSKCLGYRVTGDGMWQSEACCAMVPLHKCVNDAMHVYFSNGVASLELCLLVDAVKKETKKDVSDMLAAVEETGWQRSGMAKRSGQNKWWTKRLFTPSFFNASMYKGNAKQTQALISLLRWLAEGVWIHQPQLRVAAKSFLKLCVCLDVLKSISQTRAFDELAAAQRDHMEAFQCAWPDFFRPKHHHALHLGMQYAETDCFPNCWGTESKHRDYKEMFARILQHRLTQTRGGAAFGESLMPRLLNRHVEMLNQNPIAPHGFLLLKQFTSEEVLRVVGMANCEMASQCRVAMLELKDGDLLLWNHACNAGRCHFFLSKNNELFIYVTMFELKNRSAALRRFQITDQKKMIKWSNLLAPCVPSWWREIHMHVQCLP